MILLSNSLDFNITYNKLQRGYSQDWTICFSFSNLRKSYVLKPNIIESVTHNFKIPYLLVFLYEEYLYQSNDNNKT